MPLTHSTYKCQIIWFHRVSKEKPDLRTCIAFSIPSSSATCWLRNNTLHLLKFQQPQEVSCPSPVSYAHQLHHVSVKFMLSIGTVKAIPNQTHNLNLWIHAEFLSLKHTNFHVSQKVNLKNSPVFPLPGKIRWLVFESITKSFWFLFFSCKVLLFSHYLCTSTGGHGKLPM